MRIPEVMPQGRAGITILTSDRPTILMERLAHDLGTAPLSPLEDEIIVTQSQGMSKWIRLELARRHGCAASLRMPFPAAFCYDILARREAARRAHSGSHAGAPAASIDESFTRDILIWRIQDLLQSGLTSDPALRPLVAFLADGDARKRLGLAERLAGRFDDYQMYRPDVLLQWEEGSVADSPHDAQTRWQAELWRRLCEGKAPRHLARAFTSLIEDLGTSTASDGSLPRRVSVFGVSTLPPLFVRLLHGLARMIPVRVYVAAPPRDTWRPSGGNGRDAAHPLFRAFGTQSRQFLESLGVGDPAWEEHYTARGGEGAAAPSGSLATLQQDMRVGRAEDAVHAADRPVLESTDASIRVHRCHSPMREMEVLRDQLLAALAADATLRPHDVLVLVPDITAYAPFIEAVFGVTESGLPPLPFHIADRLFIHEHSIVDSVLGLLSLVDSRLTSAEVLALLDVPAIRLAAKLDDHAPPLVHRWVSDTRIRWGVDGADRAQRFDVPAVEANTWRAGLDRLLMGYATGPVQDLVAGVLPEAGALAGDAATLGAFADWADRLFATLDQWRIPRPLDDWREALLAGLDEFFVAADEDEANALQTVRRRIDALGRTRLLSGNERAVDIAVLRDWLEHALDDEGFGSGFLVGGMTFCALKPMRSIPFKVIAVAGLDDASFPRRDRRAAFDLMEIAPRPGDRNLREDDRQLFLDILFAAEQQLILSYVGRSITDNKERAMSVVLAELLDHMDTRFRTDEADPQTGRERPARDRIIVDHRLQPFSPAYFARDSDADPRLFSYSRSNADALAASRTGREEPAPFVPAEMLATLSTREPRPREGANADEPERLEISLTDLTACWKNPSRFFCERALDLKLPFNDDEDEEQDDAEPVTVDGLTRWAVHDEMLRMHLAGIRDPELELRRATARGTLPPGALAQAWFATLDGEMDDMLLTLPAVTPVEPRVVAVAGDGWEITGRLDWLTTDGRVVVHAATMKPKYLLRAWIAHLLLNAVDSSDLAPPVSFVYCSDKAFRFPAVRDARQLLDALVRGYRRALITPLPVFEKASYAFWEQVVKLRTRSSASREPIACAQDSFESSDRRGRKNIGDDIDAYVALVWRGRKPLAEQPDEFARLSETLWSACFEHRQELGG